LRGFTLSARPGSDDWYLNCHVGASPFIKEGKLHVLFQLLKTMDLAPRDVLNCLKNREVMINNPGGAPLRRIITEIGDTRLQSQRTWSEFDRELESRNRTALTQLPVNVGPRATTSDIHLAGDMIVQGFHAFRGLLTPAQTTRMLEFACKLPVYNKRHIRGAGFGMFGISTQTGQSRIADFGLAVENDLLKIPARLLAPPGLLYRRSKIHGNRENLVTSMEASWNLARMRFFAPAITLKRVLVMKLDPGFHRKDLSRVAEGLQKELQALGMVSAVVDDTVDLRASCSPVIPEENELQQCFQKILKPFSAVFVVLPKSDYDLYSRIKRVADPRLGHHFICATAPKTHNFRLGLRNQGTTPTSA
jgi:hypothetical protein